MKHIFFLATLFSSLATLAQSNQDSLSTFTIFLSAETCQTEVTEEHHYIETIDSVQGLRIIEANGIPNHKTGLFPNEGNPNTIQPQVARYEIPLNPTPVATPIPGMGIRTGILFSGVELDPFTGEFFIGERGANRQWNITTLTSSVNLGLDCNNAHVQPGGKYHYHGTPNAYLEQLGADQNEMIKVGYAADGYPIYYKYGYGTSGALEVYTSGYVLKEGNRPGDGKSAPNGTYDGTYFQDYEYKEGISELDECNGRTGRTPESESEYYYIITDNFPSSPICFNAEPSDDFRNVRPSENRRETQQTPPTGRPSPEELIRTMDQNGDQKLDKSEVRGPLATDFDRVDANKDGFITLSELKQMPPRPQ